MLAPAFTGCSSESGSTEEDANGNQQTTTPGQGGQASGTMVIFTEVTADGTEDGEGPYMTTVLALHFSMEIYGLSAANITLTDIGGTGATAGDDEETTNGTENAPLKTIKEALARAKNADKTGWPAGASAEIVLLSNLTLAETGVIRRLAP